MIGESTTMIFKMFLNLLLKENIKKIVCVSRLTWKNKVYYIKTSDMQYAVKVFKNKHNGTRRFKNEEYFYNYFTKSKLINVPKVIYSKNYLFFSIIITEWLEYPSLKQLINKNGLKKNHKSVEGMFIDLHKIWDLKLNDFYIYSDNNIYNSCNHDIKYLIKKLSSKRRDLKDLYHTIYNIYVGINKNSKFLTNNIINNDISLHEFFVCNDKYYWIDFENFTYGDINSDLAGVFYSLTNSFIEDTDSINYLYKRIEREKYFNKEKFIYYLIERLLLADYLCKNEIDSNEISFYLKYIIKMYKKI